MFWKDRPDLTVGKLREHLSSNARLKDFPEYSILGFVRFGDSLYLSFIALREGRGSYVLKCQGYQVRCRMDSDMAVEPV